MTHPQYPPFDRPTGLRDYTDAGDASRICDDCLAKEPLPVGAKVTRYNGVTGWCEFCGWEVCRHCARPMGDHDTTGDDPICPTEG